MTNTLKTWEFGTIRIVKEDSLNKKYDTFIRFDILGEWGYWQTVDGEILAVEQNN